MAYLLIAVVSVSASFLLAVVLWRLGIRYGWHREIRARDVHKEPTPRLGGIALYAAMGVGALVASTLPEFSAVFDNPRPVIAVFGGAFIVVALGVVDDLIDLD